MNLTPAALTARLDKLTHLDLSTLDIRKFELPTFELPTFEFPTFELPDVELPKVELPKVDMPIDAERVATWARDVAYVGIGAAVVVSQQVAERARKLVDSVR